MCASCSAIMASPGRQWRISAVWFAMVQVGNSSGVLLAEQVGGTPFQFCLVGAAAKLELRWLFQGFRDRRLDRGRRWD